MSLACPECNTSLEDLECKVCGVRFTSQFGVPCLLPGGQVQPTETPLCDLSVFVMARNEGTNLGPLLKEMHSALVGLEIDYELLVIDGNSTDSTVSVATDAGATVYVQKHAGYGNGFREGLALCRGQYVLTFDADGSHDPNFIRVLWQHREQADLVVGSRYVDRGEAWMPWSRLLLSRILNLVISGVLSLPLKDISSGFRLYRRAALTGIELEGRDFNILIELLSKLLMEGFRVVEIPFLYKPRIEGHSKARLLRFAVSYATSIRRLWHLRYSEVSADFDNRRYHCWSVKRRAQERRRYQAVTAALGGKTSGILVINCGTDKLIQSLPGAVGLDTCMRKLRFLRVTNPSLVQADPLCLPFADAAFDVVVCPRLSVDRGQALAEVSQSLRVLKPGGKLICLSSHDDCSEDIIRQGCRTLEKRSLDSTECILIFEKYPIR